MYTNAPNNLNRQSSAAIANAIATAEKEGVNEDDIRGILDKYNDIWDSAVKGFDSDFSSFMGAASSSASGTAEKTPEEIRTE